MKYPEFVKRYKPKGTIVKKKNDVYYAYYATSKRVEGKNYPVQVIKGLAGKIDEYGFHPMTRAVVDTQRVIVRECGFTNYLLTFEDIYLSQRSEPTRDKRIIYRSLIVYLSNNSYLIDESDVPILPIEKLVERYHVGIPNQITALNKLTGHELKELEPLKYICNVRMGNRVFNSELSSHQKELLERIEIDEKYIR